MLLPSVTANGVNVTATFFKQSNAAEVYEIARSVITLVPKGPVAKVLVQQAASQLTSISRSVETYRA